MALVWAKSTIFFAVTLLDFSACNFFIVLVSDRGSEGLKLLERPHFGTYEAIEDDLLPLRGRINDDVRHCLVGTVSYLGAVEGAFIGGSENLVDEHALSYAFEGVFFLRRFV